MVNEPRVDDVVIRASGLAIDYRIGKGWLNALSDIHLSVTSGEIHGLVGESGSGKSTLGLGMMRYLADNARISAGEIIFDGQDMAQLDDGAMRKIWGRSMSLVPQNPLDSLNPTLTIGKQMMELTQWHLGLARGEARQRAIEALMDVKIADPERIIGQYPHQLSGGMQQRVMIALALSTRPGLLVLDEPTTALDVTTQAVILDLVRELIKKDRGGALYVSHDLGTIAQLCDSVTVLYAGEVMEKASAYALFDKPLHPYTMGLLASIPSANTENESRLATIGGVAPSLAERSRACVFANRCAIAVEHCHQEKPPLEVLEDGRAVRCWRWQEVLEGRVVMAQTRQETFVPAPPKADLVLEARGIRKQFREGGLWARLFGQANAVEAVHDISLRVRGRSTVGIVGESGSGKTTLARALVALDSADEGEISLLDVPLNHDLRARDKEVLRNLRMIFQNPNDALNPYKTVGEVIGRTFRALSDEPLTGRDIKERVLNLLEAVGLTAEYYGRTPSQLSGGEKQRVAIARAFAANPALIIADEPTSALDVSVQAVILNLLKDLRAREGASYVIISHDLEVISYVADWIVVMYLGEVVEQGTMEDVYNVPSHPYTEALLSAVPYPDPRKRQGHIRLEGDVPSPRHKPSGCPFHTRCPRYIGDICRTDAPPVRHSEDGHQIRCHHEIETLIRLQTDEGGV